MRFPRGAQCPTRGWLAKINKHLFNPRQVRPGKHPVVTHLGRRSGATHHTPLDAFPTETGFVLVVRYGREPDWVRNVLAAGTAHLRVGDVDHALTSPRLVSRPEALDAMVDDPPKDPMKVDESLLMEMASR